MTEERTFTSFADTRLVASGPLELMLRRTREQLERDPHARLLIFDDRTGRQVDFDFRGSPDEVVRRAAPPKPRVGPGRPKLGVVSREVSLLPRHWEWLERQPQGISGALRRLVDAAAKAHPDRESARLAREAAGQFMWTMAGNLPGFEEASRALYANDHERLAELVREWPADVRSHLLALLDRSQPRSETGAGAAPQDDPTLEGKK